MYTLNRQDWEVYALLKKLYPQNAHSYKVKMLRKKDIPFVNPWGIAFSDCESITKKRFFPFHFTEEEKQQYINENWEIIESPYDCSGKWFTMDIIFCSTKNGTWVYHKKALDI